MAWVFLSPQTSCAEPGSHLRAPGSDWAVRQGPGEQEGRLRPKAWGPRLLVVTTSSWHSVQPYEGDNRHHQFSLSALFLCSKYEAVFFSCYKPSIFPFCGAPRSRVQGPPSSFPLAP